MSIYCLGIRHHGPGSSRHTLKAIEELKPDILLIEGPPEGEAILTWIAHEDMKPPVALLAYVPDNPMQAVFYPFAYFSPEWNAIQYGLSHKLPIRLIDMPLAHKLAFAKSDESMDENNKSETLIVHKDPIGHLAKIDGFNDSEEWWEHKFELAEHSIEVFDAIADSMSALREALPQDNILEQRREAFMRKAIRLAQQERYNTILVICGAWHVPALQNMPSQKVDNELLKQLPKTKIATTWIPWTNSRLSLESGYGAGIDSPGYYEHIWNYPNDNGAHWLTLSARLFRENKIDISSAHIIEAVLLVEALLSLRGLQKPGLKELNEAAQTVMCMGDGILLNIIRKELIVGNRIGKVPEGSPQVPLQADFQKLQKKLRLKLTEDKTLIKLDLREENDLQKSIFLHRLVVLNVNWGAVQRASGKGTFKEEWLLQWYPELTIHLLEKAPWGNTIEMAANHYLQKTAEESHDLKVLADLIQKAIPAELHTGVKLALQKMDALAASSTDIDVLIDCFMPMVQICRYSNVRKTDMDTIQLIVRAIFYRISLSLPLSCSHIDEEHAAKFSEKIIQMNQSVLLLDNQEYLTDWLKTVREISDIEQTAPLILGNCCKILYDLKVKDSAETAIIFSNALSSNNDAQYSAGWIEGFLKNAATVLIMDDVIWDIVNSWVASLDEEAFIQTLPLLRRTFSDYTNTEKRKIAQRAGKAVSVSAKGQTTDWLNHERARKIIPLLEKLMGLTAQ